MYAMNGYFRETGKDRHPLVLTATIVDNSGRTWSEETLEACIQDKDLCFFWKLTGR